MSGHLPPADPGWACRTVGGWPLDMLRVSVDITHQSKSVRLPSQKRRTTNPKAPDYQEGRGMPGEGRVPHCSYGVASSPDGLFSDNWNTLATNAGFRRYDGFRAGIPPNVNAADVLRSAPGRVVFADGSLDSRARGTAPCLTVAGFWNSVVARYVPALGPIFPAGHSSLHSGLF